MRRNHGKQRAVLFLMSQQTNQTTLAHNNSRPSPSLHCRLLAALTWQSSKPAFTWPSHLASPRPVHLISLNVTGKKVKRQVGDSPCGASRIVNSFYLTRVISWFTIRWGSRKSSDPRAVDNWTLWIDGADICQIKVINQFQLIYLQFTTLMFWVPYCFSKFFSFFLHSCLLIFPPLFLVPPPSSISISLSLSLCRFIYI